MKIGVAGTGSVGGYYGGKLKKAGHEVVFLARDKNLERMKVKGLTVESDSEKFTVYGSFTDRYESFSDVDLLLFCVKSTDTQETALALKPYIMQEAIILTLQNGVDNEEILSSLFEGNPIFSAAAYIQVTTLEPGVVKQIGLSPTLVMGGLDESGQGSLMDVSSLLKKAGIEVHVSNHIAEIKWKKLLWNVTFNPLTALLEIQVGEILDDGDLKNTAIDICKEATSVARRIGIEIDDRFYEQILAQGSLARNHQTSMLQDKLNGKRMEVESICGFIVKKGRELNVETPILETIYHLLKFQDAH